jgi:hypothetical protein
MSLINDALKRAKEAHQQMPVPPPNLPFRPVEPAQQCARHSLGLLLPVALALVALLVLFLGWQWMQRRAASQPVEAAALGRRAAGSAAEAPPSSLPVDASAAVPAPARQPQPPLPGSAAAPAADTAAAVTDPPAGLAQESQGTNAVPAVAPEPPKPAPLRLQAILFHPKRPSAIVSGKTVFVGDKVADLRVAAIGQDSVVLTGAGQTNILSLPQ